MSQGRFHINSVVEHLKYVMELRIPVVIDPLVHRFTVVLEQEKRVVRNSNFKFSVELLLESISIIL